MESGPKSRSLSADGSSAGGAEKDFVALPDAPPNPIDVLEAKCVEMQRKCLIGLENDEPGAGKQESFDAAEVPAIETLYIQEEKYFLKIRFKILIL